MATSSTINRIVAVHKTLTGADVWLWYEDNAYPTLFFPEVKEDPNDSEGFWVDSDYVIADHHLGSLQPLPYAFAEVQFDYINGKRQYTINHEWMIAGESCFEMSCAGMKSGHLYGSEPCSYKIGDDGVVELKR